ncbi:hypothetical protein EYF80_011564 [Liparis tanakae]|uniref:Uncharacterized protein n=1 Tax=Liparis tanakae TaxID=230148 RepID=A0A4Z2ILJ3_9TELE|nr:hypothetical protein EYF80_011564 [Liparis tanakae]
MLVAVRSVTTGMPGALGNAKHPSQRKCILFEGKGETGAREELLGKELGVMEEGRPPFTTSDSQV